MANALSGAESFGGVTFAFEIFKGMSVWRLQLLGEPKVSGLDQEIKRFESRRAVALLAYLVLHPNYAHPREVLVDRIWPEVDPQVGRNRLKQALASLRRLLEPPILAPGTVFIADKQSVQIRPGSFSCDLIEVLESLGASLEEWQRDADLLPGYYDEWLDGFRTRYDAIRFSVFESAEEQDLPQTAREAQLRTRLPEKIGLQPEIRSFIGRDKEIEEVASLTRSDRIVTLIGIGGIGKTSLVNRIGLIEPDRRVIFVSFAGTPDLSVFFHLIGQRIGVTSQDSNRVEEVVLQALALEPTLLILDNLEQLAGPSLQSVLRDLLAASEDLDLLLTSRVDLGIGGSTRNLSFFPVPEDFQEIEAVSQLESTRLFVERARKSRADFQITPRNLGAMKSLLKLLGGHPLAIELCASWVPMFSVSEILSRLSESKLVLSSKSTQYDLRHSSLDQVLATSFELLNPGAKDLLIKAAVLRGDFSYELLNLLEDGGEIIDSLSELIFSGYIHTVEVAGDTKYRIPQALLRFLNHYEGIDEEVKAAEHRLDEALLSLLRDSRSMKVQPLLGIQDQTGYMTFLQSEWETVWNSMQRMRGKDPSRATKAWLDCLWYWIVIPESQLIYHELLEMSNDSRLEAELLPICETLGLLSYKLGHHLTYVLEQLELKTTQQFQEGSLAWAECSIIRARFNIKLVRRLDKEFAEKVAAYWAAEGDTFRKIFIHRMYVTSVLVFNTTDDVLPLIDLYFTELSKSNWNLLFQLTKFDRGQYFFYKGDYKKSTPIFESIVEWGEKHSNPRLICLSSSFLASSASVQKRWTEAVILFARTGLFYVEFNDIVALSFPIWNLADHLINQEEQYLWGMRVAGCSAKVWRHAVGTDLPEEDQQLMREWMKVAEQSVPRDQLEAALQLGSSMSLAEITDLLIHLDAGGRFEALNW